MWWDTEAICLVLPASADVDTIGRLASAWNVGGRRLREVTRDSYFDRDAAIADGTLLAGERIYPFWYDHESSKKVVVEHRWLSPEEADVLMPWYPGGVQALLDGRIGYYGHAAGSSGV